MKPLQGLRIVSVEQFGAAPYGTMFLADLGAEVIKVEIDGERLEQVPCSPMGADNAGYLAEPPAAKRAAAP